MTTQLARSRPALPAAAAAAAAATLCLTLLGCGSFDLGGANIFSVSDEWKLGSQMSGELERELQLNRDPEALRLLTQMGMEIVRQSRMANLEWQFHLVRDPAVNAFNIPGGHVYVNEGLLAAADNASEFLAVMGHEVAHGVARHGTQHATKAIGLSVLLDVALGRNPGVAKSLAGNVAATGAMAHYSREAEREADDMGIRFMAAAGYDPNGMVVFFEKLLALRQSRPDRVSKFFGSHPLAESRIAEARRSIDALPEKGGWRTDSDSFRQLKARLRQ